MNRSVVVVGMGLQTAIGVNLPANIVAVHAGLNVFRLSDYLLSYRTGEHLKISQLQTLSKELSAFERMKAMAVASATEALQEVLEATGGVALEICLLLSAPPSRPGFPEDGGAKLFQELTAVLPVRVRRNGSGVGALGHDGGLAAVDQAVRMIRAGLADFCLVGGADCYLTVDTLQWLETQDRLKVKEQPNGFIPGEGAGFVLLASAERAAQLRLTAPIQILATGRGREERLWFSDLPNLGMGLTQAFHAIYNSGFAPPQQVRTTYCDLNGEAWRADEWGYAYVRTGERHASPVGLRHPASNWGDLGAATGPALIALASADLVQHPDPNDIFLAWTASDMHPSRSACLLGRTERTNA
jgi:3-oxoacyl-[acyl-carrier-protein] synthase I